MPSHPAEALKRSFLRDALLILWPSFVMAGVLEVLVFAFVDPDKLHSFGADHLEVSHSTVYSVAFLTFWAVTSTSGVITRLLHSPSAGGLDRGRNDP